MSQGEGGGRKPVVLTNEQIIEVGALAAVLSQEQIADYFGIARNTFSAIIERQPEVNEQYKRGKARAIGKVAQGLIKQANNGNIAASIFYLKTQAGWKETNVQEHTGANGDPISLLLTQVQGNSLGVSQLTADDDED